MLLVSKYQSFSWFICLLFLSLVFTVSCKSKEKLKDIVKETPNVFHCSGSDYLQNADFFRIDKIGESVDQPTSMKKAIQLAQQELAESIISILNVSIENYITTQGLHNDELMKEQIFALTYPVSEASINKVNIICEESIKTLNGLYKTYVVLEISVKEVLNELQKTMAQNKQFQVRINASEFKKIFQSNMNKRINEQIFK